MDIAAAVGFAARGNVLELPDLRDVAKTLGVLQNLKGALRDRTEIGLFVIIYNYVCGEVRG